MVRRFVLASLFLLSACSAGDPYLYVKDEFDRERPGFGREPQDLEEVTVCYGSSGTQPAAVTDLARDACARVGKVARFRAQDLRSCPLTTPVAAHYDCLAPTPGGGRRGLF
ncbi:MAG: hypothetical protein KDE22_10095 [Rhodobacterales bacterium]|nr:hypothetical protein [Rhodobacterales bacterium]